VLITALVWALDTAQNWDYIKWSALVKPHTRETRGRAGGPSKSDSGAYQDVLRRSN